MPRWRAKAREELSRLRRGGSGRGVAPEKLSQSLARRRKQEVTKKKAAEVPPTSTTPKSLDSRLP